jgi:hypothetical protein
MASSRPGSVSGMSESFVNPIFGERAQRVTQPVTEPMPEPATQVAVEGTGNADVDGVVGSLAGLDDLPIADHVAVFEQAHESLRRTLSGAGQTSPAADRG